MMSALGGGQRVRLLGIFRFTQTRNRLFPANGLRGDPFTNGSFYTTDPRLYYQKGLLKRATNQSAKAQNSAEEVIMKCNNISSFMECKNIFAE